MPSGKIERLLQIFSGANNRAAHRDTVQYHIKDREIELARRQSVKHHGSTAPQRADGLFKRRRRHGGDQRRMCAAELRVKHLCRIVFTRVHHQAGAETLRESQLLIVNIYRGDV